MYCGDDVEAVVGDIGTGQVKFGLAGEDTPTVAMPSIAGKRISTDIKTKDIKNDTQLSSYIIGMNQILQDNEIISIKNTNGEIKDWNAFEKMWSYAFHSLFINSTEHPVIMSTPTCFPTKDCEINIQKDQEKMMEIMFETFQVPAFYLAKDAMLDSFAFGRSTALIIDIGASSTRVVPVFDGYPLVRPAKYSFIGCNELSIYLKNILQQKYPEQSFLPRCCYSREYFSVKNAWGPPILKSDVSLQESYTNWMQNQLYNDMREAMCVVPTTDLGDPLQWECETMSYELPDGTNLTLGIERYEVGNYLFNSKPTKSDAIEQASNASTSNEKHVSSGLHRLVYDAIQQCDADIRRDMLGNIILCGGGSLTPGITERLHSDLTALVPSSFKVRLTSVMKIERQFSCFIGGSILASLGSFQQLWVSKYEYDEIGSHQLWQDRFS